jgi:malate dehydrogenase (oxaloacetate-decarboxylating)
VAIDYTYRVRSTHRRGQIARIAEAISEAEGLIGDIQTINLTRRQSIREITIECRDRDHAKEIAGKLEETDGVTLLWCRDRALMKHEGGKLTIEPVRRVESLQEMRDVYTPGVAQACRAIADDPKKVTDYTMIGRTVAICTNGTRVLGLGDIGPRASMPVMEGKAVFYRQFAGISAMPILIDTHDPDEFVATVERIALTFGGIHLEDIDSPACFDIEERLIESLDMPVMHDDVHGTAVVTLAAALVGCSRADKEFGDVCVGQIGLGAAGFGIASLMKDGGAKRVLASDPNEASHARAREEGIEIVSYDELMDAADVVVATTGKPGLIEAGDVKDDQIILALSNPEPEIEPMVALEAGAAFAADGSAVNNVLGYPGIFRGALLAGATAINTEMKVAAAHAIAALAEESELVPDVFDSNVHERVAEAVKEAAEASGAADADRAATGL